MFYRRFVTALLDTLTKDVLALPATERAKLAHMLIHSLDEQTDKDVERAWDKEIERRVREIKNGTAVGKPAAEVFAEIRAKYQ